MISTSITAVPEMRISIPSVERPISHVSGAIRADATIGKKVLTMGCKYCQEEVCVNADCPMCADYCPVVDVPGVCRFEERGFKNE